MPKFDHTQMFKNFQQQVKESDVTIDEEDKVVIEGETVPKKKVFLVLLQKYLIEEEEEEEAIDLYEENLPDESMGGQPVYLSEGIWVFPNGTTGDF